MTWCVPSGSRKHWTFAGPQIGKRLGDRAAELDQLPVLDRHALDRLAALGLDHRARDRVQAAPVEVAEDVDRELLALADRLHEARHLARAEEEVELLAVVRALKMWREPKPRRAFTSTGNGRSSGSSSGSQLGGEGIPLRLEERGARGTCRAVMRTTSSAGSSTDGAERVAALREQLVVEVGERDDQADVVGEHEVAERIEVAGVVDARHERVAVGVVERRRERVDVGGDRRRAGARRRRSRCRRAGRRR